MLGVISSTYGGLYTIGGLPQGGGLGDFSGGGYGVGAIGAGFGLNEGATASPYALGKQQGSYQVKLSAYGQLRSALDNFNSALDKLKKPQSVAPFKATSSSESVLTASASADTAKAGSYGVTVNQLATAQTLTSATFADANATIVGSGSLTIQVGSYNANLNSFTQAAGDTMKTLAITPVSGTLGGIANAINNANVGVNANVVQTNGGGYRLSLTASNSGTENTVKITAVDSSGSPLTGNTGLGQLAFDPTATVGNGKNLTVSAVAQNAQLTVDGVSVSSQSNVVTSAVKNVTLSLSSTGTSAVTVNVNRDSAAFSASAQQFVDAFNGLQSAAAALTQPSIASVNPPLANDGLLSTIASTIRQVVSQASSGYGADQLTLPDIGINRQFDGMLSLNQTTLASAFQQNPDGAAKLLANTGQKLSDIVTANTGPSSPLQFTTNSLERVVQNIENRKSALQDYSAQTYFGLPTQYSLFTYMFSSNNIAGALSHYSQVSRL